MIEFKDRVVQFPNRVKLTPVSGQPNVYDVSRQEGNITQEGTSLNSDTFKSLLLHIQNQDDKRVLKITPPQAGAPTKAYVVFNTGDGYLEVTSGWADNSIVQRNFRGTFEVKTPQPDWDIHSCATLENVQIVENAFKEFKARIQTFESGTYGEVIKPKTAFVVLGTGTLRVRSSSGGYTNISLNSFSVITLSRGSGINYSLRIEVLTVNSSNWKSQTLYATQYGNMESWSFQNGSGGGTTILSF